MQVVINNCFLLTLPPPKKKMALIHFVFFEKNVKNAPLILNNDVTEPKASLLE